jgi:hypothetical protein
MFISLKILLKFIIIPPSDLLPFRQSTSTEVGFFPVEVTKSIKEAELRFASSDRPDNYYIFMLLTSKTKNNKKIKI